ncbi:dCTP deaminase domain-containing protein [Marivita sp. S0852]|uniref:dCTP deaminase domain-containing protein n=1 Tax=Marivita sp. S0852 TaxID=3373893 RepID=UPI00398250FF
MAFWSGEKLGDKLPNLIEPFDTDAIDCAAYTLHIGDEVYISPDREIASPSRHSKKKLQDGEAFAIPPGQFGFLTTKEVVTVPDNALAFISIKARQKFSGLVNISGFHVDPGYKGELIFSVLNAGPRPLHLTHGQPLFLIWYADLDRETALKKKPGDGLQGIDPKLINGISGEILSLQSLSEKQRALESDLNQKLQKQQTQVSIFRALVMILITLAVGLVGWELRTYVSIP